MEKIIFREYNSNDREACIKIYNSNVPHFFDSIELDGFKNWLTSKDNLIKAHKTNTLESYSVVLLKNKIIGCGGFYFTENNTEARMAWGMIEHSYHKLGFGKLFLEYRILQIQALNPKITIALDTTQNTFKFFEKMNFKVTSIRKDYYTKGLDRYDMVKD